MHKPHRNVLAIGVSRQEFDRMVPFLSRQLFDVDRFPSASGALELISQVPFEMLLVRYPLPDMPMDAFLKEVRQPGGPCHRSSLLVLTTSGLEIEARRFIGQGANRTINLEASGAEIQQSVSSVLHVAPRKDARFMARLEVRISGAKDMIICQTENLSASGMLIRIDQRYDIGTQIEFEFQLQEDSRPVRGVAEVMRHTNNGRDAVGGIGLRFISFAGDSQHRFELFLRGL